MVKKRFISNCYLACKRALAPGLRAPSRLVFRVSLMVLLLASPAQTGELAQRPTVSVQHTKFLP